MMMTMILLDMDIQKLSLRLCGEKAVQVEAAAEALRLIICRRMAGSRKAGSAPPGRAAPARASCTAEIRTRRTRLWGVMRRLDTAAAAGRRLTPAAFNSKKKK